MVASFEMDWDSEEHVETVRHRVAHLTDAIAKQDAVQLAVDV